MSRPKSTKPAWPPSGVMAADGPSDCWTAILEHERADSPGTFEPVAVVATSLNVFGLLAAHFLLEEGSEVMTERRAVRVVLEPKLEGMA